VLTIRALQKEKQQSRDWVFGWLLNRNAPTPSKEKAAERLALLPARYRGIQTEGSMDVAYYTIPAEIRDYPERYLPAADPRREPPHWPGWDGGPLGPALPD